MRSTVYCVARSGAMILISRPSVSCSGKYAFTFSMIWASWARSASNQKMGGVWVARARVTASLTQSRTGTSLVWVARQMSPVAPWWLISTLPAASTTSTVPSYSMMKVLSWEPYSSAFWAIIPTLGTVPMVVGSNAPLTRQSWMTAWNTPAYEESGITARASWVSSFLFHILPPERIMAGMEASTMTSEGTCRLVIQRCEVTIDRKCVV